MERKSRVVEGCCSCLHKVVRADGTRVCAKMQLVVGQKFRSLGNVIRTKKIESEK